MCLKTLQNTICVRKGKRALSSRSVWENSPFYVFVNKNIKHYKIGASAGTWGKPKNHLLWRKGLFRKGPLKGCLLSVIYKSCVLLKTLYYSSFSKSKVFAEKGLSCKSTNMVDQHAKRCFFFLVACLVWGGWLHGILLCFCVFCGLMFV